jgi:REP element-mobilizing transposase RayT/membrane protease YdiL (CAAX protease family)
MTTSAGTKRSPLIFFLLVFALSVPFWLLCAAVPYFLPKSIPINLPTSSLMFFTPMFVALVLEFRNNGLDGLKSLLRRPLDYRRIGRLWYLPMFLFMPFVMIVEYGLLLLLGKSIPDPQFPILLAPVLFVVFFVAAAGEEIGWQGYAFGPLQDRWNALGAGVILGVVWAVWHIVPFIQARHTPAWIAGQCLFSVGLRILIVWLYNHTGMSLFAAITLHAMSNVCTFMFSNYGSLYDPLVASVLIWLTVGIVSLSWGRETPPGSDHHAARAQDPMKHDPAKHHRRSIRLKGYDYAQPGAYFITLCVQNRECMLGEIENGEMRLNAVGVMAQAEWQELQQRFPGVTLDAFTIMPNHMHGIIIIEASEDASVRAGLVPALAGASTRDAPTNALGHILGACKSITTPAYIMGVRQSDWPPFSGKFWQRNYYEHIVRDEADLARIRAYIQNNPAKWAQDQLHPAASPNRRPSAE